MLVAAALFIYLRWDQIPERYPIHWNSHGEIDGWGGRSVRQLSAPLIMGAAMVSMMLVMVSSLARHSRQVAASGPAAAAEQQYKRGTLRALVAVLYVLAGVFAGLAVLPAAGSKEAGVGFIAFIALIPVINLSLMYWMIRRGQGGQRLVSAADRAGVVGDATPDAAWKGGGLLYFNRNDPALWVEKRVGFGWTLNFGHPRSWMLMGLMLLPALLFPLLL